MLPSVLPTESDHVPVLADEVVATLDPRPGETVVDAHLRRRRPLRHCSPRACSGEGKLIAIDRDPTRRAVLRAAPPRDTPSKARLLSRRVLDRARAAARRTASRADAILLDLGVSSMQLDRPERGFSYAVDAPLDMRMDPSCRATPRASSSTRPTSASSPTSSSATARSATRARSPARSSGGASRQPFERTGDLVETIKAAIPAPARFGEGHPAKRVFQALRIEVNDELGALERALPAALEMLRPGGRLARDLVPLARGPDRQALPAQRRSTAARARPTSRSASAAPSRRCARRRAARSGPSAAEVARNPRAQSARLRVGTKVG